MITSIILELTSPYLQRENIDIHKGSKYVKEDL
jgi:hypothetical protein